MMLERAVFGEIVCRVSYTAEYRFWEGGEESRWCDFVTTKLWRKRASLSRENSDIDLSHSHTLRLLTITMAKIILSGVSDDADVQGTLFQGTKFWISHKVPQRSRFISDVKVKCS